MSRLVDDLPQRVREACQEWRFAQSTEVEARTRYKRLNAQLMFRIQKDREGKGAQDSVDYGPGVAGVSDDQPVRPGE